MNQLEDLQAAVEETTAAAHDYRLHEDDIGGRTDLARLLIQRDGWPLAALQRAFLDVAAQHRADCGLEDCRTCASIRHGLASTLAALRVLVAEEERVVPQLRRLIA